MPSLLRTSHFMIAASIAAFGLLCLFFADFISALQPMAKDNWPPALAYATGVVFLAGGIGLIFTATMRMAALVILGLLLVWILLLHVPILVDQPRNGTAWVGLLECVTFSGMMLMLSAFPGTQGTPPAAWDGFAGKAAPWGRMIYGASLIPAGVQHFIYADFVASLIPSWLPGSMFWTLATGAALIAAGFAILVNIKARLAGILLGVMFASWVLTLHIPLTLAAMGQRPQWTSLWIAIAFTGGAWLVAALAEKKAEGQMA